MGMGRVIFGGEVRDHGLSGGRDRVSLKSEVGDKRSSD